MILRDVIPADTAAIQAIYAHHVLNGTGTFEESPPTVPDMQGRIDAILARGLPYIVAEDAGAIAGFAYAGPFRLRAAYRYTAEDSIYVAPGRVGQGVGKALLSEIVLRCQALGLHQLIGVIGDSANAASVGVHKACGFELQGVLPGLGFKHGRWLDVVWMQKALNGGAGAAPKAAGLDL